MRSCRFALAAEKREKTPQAFGEIVLGSDEAQNQVAIRREIIKMARMDVEVLFFEQFDGEFFVRARGGNAQDSVPAALDRQARNFILCDELAVELGEVLSNAAH